MNAVSYQAELNELKGKMYGANIHKAKNIMAVIDAELRLVEITEMNYYHEGRIVHNLKELNKLVAM